jgi:predicted nucleotidyltransferase
MSLLSILRSSKDARKVFGKRELKIIEKQLLGIALTQSEKNRLSRDIRRKFEFVKEVSRFSDEFELKKGAEIKRIVADAVDIIRDDVLFRNVKIIFLYGSSVENTRTFSSDIDIAVEFDKISVKEATLFRKRIGGKAPSMVDIQVYNLLPAKIQKEINTKGRRLYIR